MSSEEYQECLDALAANYARQARAFANWSMLAARDLWGPGIDNQGDAQVVEPLALPAPEEKP